MGLEAALQMAVRSDPGLIRSHNEDAVFVDASLGIAILADGMGGYSAGEVASGMAATRLADDLGRVIATSDPQFGCKQSPATVIGEHLRNEVGAANAAIFNASRSFPEYAGMGTTLVVAWFYDNRMSVAHVGDSRLYRWRENRLEQLTHDHSLLQEQLDNGMITAEEARYAEYRNLVTRALGVEVTVDVDIGDHDLRIGDIVLLCSDGLTDMVEDEDIAMALRVLGSSLELAAENLVQMANDNGGRDNISVILVKVIADFSVTGGWWRKCLARLW